MAEQKPKTKPTRYAILQLIEVEGLEVEAYTKVGEAEAHSPTDACKRYAGASGGDDADLKAGKFRAVPARSWPTEPHLGVELKIQPLFTYGSKDADDDEEPESDEEPEVEAPDAAEAPAEVAAVA